MASWLVHSSFLLLFVFPLSAYGQTSNLFLQPPYFPGSIAVDLNGDGKPDAVSLNGSVFLGNGDGTFTPGTSLGIPSSDSFASVLAADLNGDGKIDLVFVPSSNSSNPSVFLIFLGNGNGTFQPAMNLNTGTSLGSVALGDFNSDGKPDLVGTYTGGIFLFLGKGDGTFAGGTNISTSSAQVLTVGDLNGDSKLDIAFGDRTGNVNVLLGDGNGTFGTPIVSTGIGFPVGMVTADFNNDGRPDLAVATSSQTAVLLGNGDGTFQTPKLVSTGTYLNAIAAADFNGDGKIDLVISEGVSIVAGAAVYLGQGDGSFVAKGTYSGGGVIIADFNGDGKPDIAGVYTLLGYGDGTFQGYLLTPVDGALNVSGDFNQDGLADIASADGAGSVISIAFSNGALHPTGPVSFSKGPSYSIPGQITAMATADLNGDGKLDLVVVSQDSTTQNWSLNVLLGNGGGNFAAPITIPEGVPLTPYNLTQLVVGDFNGDRVPDVAVLNTANPGLQILLGKGDGTFGPPSAPIFVGSSPNSFVVADFNGDGKLDVAAASAAGLAILLGNGDGTFQPATFPNASVGQVFDTADFDVDGKMDLLVAEPNANSFVLLGNGDGTFGAELALPTGGQPTGSLRAVDVNRDGKPDVLEQAGLQVLVGNGDGTFQNPIAVIGGITGSSHVSNLLLAIGDFNGDGRPDALMQNNYFDLGMSNAFAVLNTSEAPAPDFLVGVSAVVPSVITPGKSGSATVTLTSVGGFAGSVTLSCSDLSSGVNCSFAPSPLNGSGSSSLTISTTGSVAVGTYPILVVGTSSNLVHERGVALTVAAAAGSTSVSLAPDLLTFAAQPIGTTSAGQALTLKNTGAAQANVSSISITGTNAGDFAQTGGNCAQPMLPAGFSCLIYVTFTPTGMGPRSATFTVNDNATGSPQMVALQGAGPDFSLASTSATTETVNPGQTANYSLALAPSAGFNQAISLTCTGAPALSTCTVSPSSVSLNPPASTNVTVTIATTAPSKGFVLPPIRDLRTLNQRPWLSLLLLSMTIIVGCFAFLYRRGRNHWIAVSSLMVLAAGCLLATSCGGSSSSGHGSPGTQPGTYTITVSGSSSSGSSAVTHSANVVLIVQ